jgi:hypothetical protein
MMQMQMQMAELYGAGNYDDSFHAKGVTRVSELEGPQQLDPPSFSQSVVSPGSPPQIHGYHEVSAVRQTYTAYSDAYAPEAATPPRPPAQPNPGLIPVLLDPGPGASPGPGRDPGPLTRPPSRREDSDSQMCSARNTLGPIDPHDFQLEWDDTAPASLPSFPSEPEPVPVPISASASASASAAPPLEMTGDFDFSMGFGLDFGHHERRQASSTTAAELASTTIGDGPSRRVETPPQAAAELAFTQRPDDMPQPIPRPHRQASSSSDPVVVEVAAAAAASSANTTYIP